MRFHIEGRKRNMTREREEKKEKKKVYRKPELTGHGKLKNVVAKDLVSKLLPG